MKHDEFDQGHYIKLIASILITAFKMILSEVKHGTRIRVITSRTNIDLKF